MNMRILLLPFFLLTTISLAADLPQIPSESIAKKKELLFSDDFNRTDMGKWSQVVETFTVEDGKLKGTQTRVRRQATTTQPAVSPHQAVAGAEVPTKDSVVECTIRFAGATSLSVEFDDRKYTGSHYGHICRAAVTLKDVTISDQRDGSMRNDINAMSSNPLMFKEYQKLLEGRSAKFPVQLEANKDYNLVVETVGDCMRVVIDGKPVAFLKSSGIDHPTKSKIELGCGGKDGYFDDIKIWNADPVTPQATTEPTTKP